MYVTILGRQPALGIAELEQLYSSTSVRWFSDVSALVDTPSLDFERLGGSQKAGRVIAELHGDWRQVSMRLIKEYVSAWSSHEGKITLGLSAYGFKVTARDVQKTGVILKSKLKNHGVSLRLIPNAEPALNTATSHHNKLGLSDNHVELLIIRAANGRVVIAESIGAQNITAIAARDQARPRTDAFVGMLPPKLARMMINMAGGLYHLTPSAEAALSDSLPRPSSQPQADVSVRSEAVSSGVIGSELTTDLHRPVLLDPFCGTGVVLQEAALLGYDVYGTDLSEKMVDYSRTNLEWITQKYSLDTAITIEQADAMDGHWRTPVDAVVCETYLGQPFSAPPSPDKLVQVRDNCNHIISSFLRNIGAQLRSGTLLVVAVPAWRDAAGNFTHLPLIGTLEKLGYDHITLKNARTEQLIYYRETQVVARELLLLKKA